MTKCLWFTGLSGAGKTTLSLALKKHFPKVQLLDGDVIRNTPLANHVGFSVEDRRNHILRMGQLAKMFVDQGIVTICSFISPEKETRDKVREMFDEGEFKEIYISTSVKECSRRDVKGLYKKAYSGEIQDFTGVSAPYELPKYPEMILDTTDLNVEECVQEILSNFFPKIEPAALYIGRWNGCEHLGHEKIFEPELEKGNSILLMIRDVAPDEKNPWTASEVKEMLDYRYENDPQVSTMIIPDLQSINYGRGVGYKVNKIEVTEKMAGISGTECRKMISEENDDWKKLVSPRIVEFLENKYGRKEKGKSRS